jgi:predicted metal-dependent phosphoesterase TrpH
VTTPPRVVASLVFGASLVAGTIADRPAPRPPLQIDGYRVLAVDFHTHSSMWSDGALTPWGLVLEAERQRLDAIAITGHNSVVDGRLGLAFARAFSSVVVLPGEEILSGRQYHLIAVGIHERIDFRQRASRAIDEIHRQGGIAIAAHPVAEFWPAYDAEAMRRLDGAEICHPMVFAREWAQRQLEAFAARGDVAAIGSSDAHGTGPLGACRTYVFAREATASSILDAVRARRTVVYGRDGRAFGDPALVARAASYPQLRHVSSARDGAFDRVSRIAGLLGLAGIFLL